MRPRDAARRKEVRVAGRLQWRAEPDDIGPPPKPLWREPARFLIGVACVVIALTAYQPWATSTTPFDGPVAFSGASGQGDGTIILFFAAITAVLAFVRAVAESTMGLARWAPFVFGLAMAFEFGTSIQTTQGAIDSWTGGNGHGERTTAFLVLGLAIAAVVIGAAFLVVGGRVRTWLSGRRSPST
jgi:hypothetical protein